MPFQKSKEIIRYRKRSFCTYLMFEYGVKILKYSNIQAKNQRFHLKSFLQIGSSFENERFSRP